MLPFEKGSVIARVVRRPELRAGGPDGTPRASVRTCSLSLSSRLVATPIYLALVWRFRQPLALFALGDAMRRGESGAFRDGRCGDACPGPTTAPLRLMTEPRTTADGVTVLYIGGLGRSGSTLLDLMLGQVPGLCAVGELSYLWARSDDDLCGCGERFAACAFWKQVGQEAFGGWEQVDRSEIAKLRSIVDRNRRISSPLPARRPPVRPRVTLCIRDACSLPRRGGRLRCVGDR